MPINCTSADQYRIDDHKLHLHPRRVADWLDGCDIAPVYLEISPCGHCNHRCRFCAMDFLGYKNRFLPSDVFARRFQEMGEAGVKAVMFAGEGEPFLHPDMTRMTRDAKAAGLDVSFTTNAVFLTPDKAEEILPLTSWIKVSCNAGTAATYARVHGAGPEEFQKVMANVEQAVARRSALGGSCAIGLQMVLLPENVSEAARLAETARDLGVDYLVIKPYSIHRQSGKTAYLDLTYGDQSALAEELAAFNSQAFRVIFRHQAMERRESPHFGYRHCLALPFGGYIDSGGAFWGCLRHIGERDFLYGDLCETGFREILADPERRERMARLTADLDIGDCRVDCRMDPINGWLNELKRPGPHVNFI